MKILIYMTLLFIASNAQANGWAPIPESHSLESYSQRLRDQQYQQQLIQSQQAQQRQLEEINNQLRQQNLQQQMQQNMYMFSR